MEIKKSDYGIKLLTKEDGEISCTSEVGESFQFIKVLIGKVASYLKDNPNILNDAYGDFKAVCDEFDCETYNTVSMEEFSRNIISLLETRVKGLSTEVVPIHQIFQVNDINHILTYVEESNLST